MGSFKDKAQGLGEGFKGNVEEAVGKATHNRDLEAHGKIDKAKGTAHQKLGEAKDAGQRVVENVKHAIHDETA